MQSRYSLLGVRKILASFGNPQNSIPTIHVAGTNGKGSVCSMIERILQTSGIRTGMNISPHLDTELERVRVNGENISREEWEKFKELINTRTSELGVSLSYHEFVTILALLAFYEQKVEYAILEVGLGGRLDASNVIDVSKICCLTSISYDHCELLGYALPEILKEKLGILTKGSSLVIGQLDPELYDVLKVDEQCIDIYKFGEDFVSECRDLSKTTYQSTICGYHDSNSELTYNLRLCGDHQIINSAVAIKVAKILGIGDSIIKEALTQVEWPGRLEKVSVGEKQFIFDAAHNRAGVDSLVTYLRQQSLSFDTLLFASKPDKEWKYGLLELSKYTNNIECYCSDPFINAEQVMSFLKRHDLKGVCHGGKLEDVVERIIASGSQFLVTGSIYMMGPVRSIINNRYGGKKSG